jgi:hypothetical protein
LIRRWCPDSRIPVKTPRLAPGEIGGRAEEDTARSVLLLLLLGLSDIPVCN